MSSGPIDTAFIEIRPDFRRFGAETQAGIRRELGTFGRGVDTSGNAGNAIRRGTGEIDKLDDSTKKLGRTFTNTSGAAALLGTNVARGAVVASAGLVGVGAAAGLAIERTAGAAIEFESAFAGVRKTVQGSEETLSRIRDDFIDLSTEIPVTTTELSAIGEAAGQLGIETSGITEFTKTVAELGVTTNLTSEQAADALARLANITQLPQSQFDNLGATIVALGNRTAATEAEIVEFGLRIAGAGNQIGLTQDQILSFGAALASVGLNAEAGGTAISTLFIRIASAVETGGKQLDQFAAVAGESGDEFARSFRGAPAQAVTTFIEGLGRIDDEGGNVFGTLDRLGLGGIRVRDALLRSAAAGDLLSTSLATGASEWEKNNALQIEADQRFRTTASGIQLMKNEVNALAIELGTTFLPGIDSTARSVGGLAGAIRGAIQDIKGSGGGFDTVNADLGELVARFQEIESERDDLARSGGFIPPTIGQDAAEVTARIREIAVALGDTPAGVDKLTRIFSAASPEIAAALRDGIITPAEQAALSVDGLGRAFLAALPRDMFTGIGAGIRSGIEDSARAAVQGVATLGAEIRSSIEDQSRQAVVTAEDAGKTIGTSLATALAQAAQQATTRAVGQAAIADEAFDRAVISGNESAQLRALKDKRAEFMAAIAKIDEIENPSDARVAQRRDLVAQTAQVTQQIASIEQGIIADQEQAANEAAARGREAAAAAEKADRAFVDGLTAGRADEENAIIAASADQSLQNDLRAHIALRNTLTVQINQKAAQIKDLEIRRDTLRDLRERRARVVAEIAQDRAGIRADAAEAATERQESRADVLADAVTIASLREDDAALTRALNAEIAFWQDVARKAKKGSDAQRDALIQIETDKQRLRNLTKKATASDQGTSVLDLLTSNTELFGRIGSNIGTPGIDPLSGFDFSESISAWLKRMDAPTQRTGSAISVRGRLDSPQAATGDPAIDRLVQALDANTEATLASAGNKGTGKGVNITSPILRNDRRFWESHQAREIFEAKS